MNLKREQMVAELVEYDMFHMPMGEVLHIICEGLKLMYENKSDDELLLAYKSLLGEPVEVH